MTEIGIAILGDPPSFGPNGEWPSLEAPPVVIAEATFTSASSEAGQVEFNKTVQKNTLARASGAAIGAGVAAAAGAIVAAPLVAVVASAATVAAIARRRRLASADELRQITFSRAWYREDPVVQLPPGVTVAHEYSTTYGVTETQTRELTRSLGLKTGSRVPLTADMSNKFGIQTTFNKQSNITRSITLSNKGSRGHRLYALWFVRDRFAVYHLGVPDGSNWQDVVKGSVDPTERTLVHQIEFTSTQDPLPTYCEVNK